ncbi:hypothetical protein C8J57DRAFT_1438153 [Mycena rebaudengoi]|nr:hypothetical protein C8J57DRAFT_1438153 [Mycena rebaudengoi]
MTNRIEKKLLVGLGEICSRSPPTPNPDSTLPPPSDVHVPTPSDAPELTQHIPGPSPALHPQSDIDVVPDFHFDADEDFFDFDAESIGETGTRDEPDPDEDDTSETPLPSAFYDHPAVRHAYIRVFVGCAFENMTHSAAKLMLDGLAVGLQFAARSTGTDIPGLDNFARTLSTVEKRLGVSTEGFITYLFVCDVCWKVHRPETLSSLHHSGRCTEEECEGTLFTSKRTFDGKLKHTPSKIMPFVDPERVIAHMLMRPGKYDQLQLWRGPGDEPGRVSPTTAKDYDAFPDPDKPMKNITDGWAWRAIKAGLVRRRTGAWKVEDVDIRELNQRFVSLPCGLVWQMNIDWFQAVKGSMHSTGALYLTLCNNPREIQYIRGESSFILGIPGPHEPSLEQMNQVLVSFTDAMKRLYNGSFRVYGHEEPQLSHSHIISNVSDLPASRKTGGLPSHNSKFFMCPCCYAHFFELTHPRCFDPNTRDASPEIAEDIFRKRGIRWSVMNELANWFPAASSSIEPMHCIFLSTPLICYLPILLNKSSSHGQTRVEKMEAFFSKIIWPVSVGRLPPSLSHGAGSVKADQWRTQISVLFLALFVAWQVDGEIPDIKAPPSAPNSKLFRAQAKSEKLVRQRLLECLMADNPSPTEEDIERVKKTKMDRSLRRHYDAVLNFTAAVRILCTREISPNEVKRAFAALTAVLPMGPLYAWWAYAYERNNGLLGRFNHNGHSGGELEGTMMRRWWKTIFIHDLITHLENIPDPSPEDINSIKLLKTYIKGGTKERKGTLESYLAQAASTGVQLSQFPKSLTIRSIPGCYRRVFEYLRELWAPTMPLYSDVSNNVPAGGSIFNGQVSAYSHVFVNGLRYGAKSMPRGISAQYGYIDGRQPVQIQHILKLFSHKPALGIAVQLLPLATDLGVGAWYADRLAAEEVVDISRLSGQFVLAPLNVRETDLWITIAYDHHYMQSKTETDEDDAED